MIAHNHTKLHVLRGLENVWPISVVFDTLMSRRSRQLIFSSVRNVIPGCVKSIDGYWISVNHVLPLSLSADLLLMILIWTKCLPCHYINTMK